VFTLLAIDKMASSSVGSATRRLSAFAKQCTRGPTTESSAAAADYDCSHVELWWDFDEAGGIFSLAAPGTPAHEPGLQEFFRANGFVVIRDVMSPQANAAAIDALVADLHEVNPATSHITDPGNFLEADLPTSPNHTFRTTCNMAFGRFARYLLRTTYMA
jgi:hypothetical protein